MKERNYFYIGELSELFDISVDSIRYYEKMGLLSPRRNALNGYREYSTTDVETLLQIREMLGLGFHIDQIKAYSANRTVDSTIRLLEQEISVINESIFKLYEQKNSIQERLGSMRRVLSQSADEKVRLVELPKRPGIMITDDNLPDAYVDYYVAKFIHEKKHPINTIGFCCCYTLDLPNSNPDSAYYRTKNVFFLSDTPASSGSYAIPAGNYLSLSYRGSSKKTKLLMPKLYAYAARHNLDVTGDPIELCHIDTYETSVTEEYLTELELPV